MEGLSSCSYVPGVLEKIGRYDVLNVIGRRSPELFARLDHLEMMKFSRKPLPCLPKSLIQPSRADLQIEALRRK